MRRAAQAFGALFIIVYATLLVVKLPGGVDSVIWYCDWVMLAAGVALLVGSDRFLSSFLVQSIIVQAPWILGALSYAFTGTDPFGVTGYLWDWPATHFLLALRHFLVIPVLFVMLRGRFESARRFHLIVGSATYLIVIGLSLVLTDATTNTNCAYRACIAFFPEFPSLLTYHLFFFLLVIALQLVVLEALRRLYLLLERRWVVAQLVALGFALLALITTVVYARTPL